MSRWINQSSAIELQLDGKRDTSGFVLLSVLFVIAIVSTITVAMIISARSSLSIAAVERRHLQASALADAGLTRAIVALEEFNESTLSTFSTPTRWRFAGREVIISLKSEAGKIDLNSGEADLVINVLRVVLSDNDKADRIIRRLSDMRRAGQYIETVRGLLDPDDRVRSLASDFEMVFTVWTNLRGVDPTVAPAITLRNLPGLQQGEAENLVRASVSRAHSDLSPFVARFGRLLGASRPIYRARAEAKVEGVTARREALLTHNPIAHTVRVVFWRDVID